MSSLRQIIKPGYGLAPRSHTFSSATTTGSTHIGGPVSFFASYYYIFFSVFVIISFFLSLIFHLLFYYCSLLNSETAKIIILSVFFSSFYILFNFYNFGLLLLNVIQKIFIILHAIIMFIHFIITKKKTHF